MARDTKEQSKIRFLIVVIKEYSKHSGNSFYDTIKLFEKMNVSRFLFDCQETIGSLAVGHMNSEIDSYIKNNNKCNR